MRTNRYTTDLNHPAVFTRLVSASEMALLTGISARRIRRLARDGCIPRIIVGHRTHRYSPEEVIEALRSLSA
jgi:DNA-binding transcriptional MerR regulator